MSNRLTLKIAAGPVAVLLLHTIGTVVGWYEIMWWFDIPMHFLGGAAITWSSYLLLREFGKQKRFTIQWLPLQILILLAFAGLAAVSWEFFEFALDIYANTDLQPSILDTMKDLAMGLSGGGLVALLTAGQNKFVK